MLSHPECVASIIRSTENVVMYDVIMEHEIMGYFVAVKRYPSTETFVEFTEKDAADVFFDKLDIRVEMAKRGICLN